MTESGKTAAAPERIVWLYGDDLSAKTRPIRFLSHIPEQSMGGKMLDLAANLAAAVAMCAILWGATVIAFAVMP